MKLSRILSFLQRDAYLPSKKTWNWVRPDTSRIVYDFGEASIPPEYHRSFLADICPNALSLKVTCYRNVLNQTTISIQPKDFRQLLEQLDNIRLEKQNRPDDEGLNGGSSHSLQLFEKGKTYFSGSMYGNGWIEDLQFGTLKGDIHTLHQTICRFIPHFEEEMKRNT